METKTNQKQLNITNIIVSAIKKGEKRKFFYTNKLLDWYHYYNYRENPLTLLDPKKPFNNKDLSLFIGRKSELQVLSNYIGHSQNNKQNYHIALIGARGVGKHTIMKIISNILLEEVQNIRFEYYSHHFDYKNSKELTNEELEKFNEKSLDVRILSSEENSKEFILNQLNDFKQNSKLIISLWNTSNYPLKKLTPDKKIFIRNFQKVDIINILKARIKQTLSKHPITKNYFQIITKEVLPKIAKFSEGNLFIAFKLFEFIHKEAILTNLEKIDNSVIETIINQFSALKTVKLTTNERKIINYYLENKETFNDGFLTSTSIVKDLKFDNSNTWKYLTSLEKKGVLIKVVHGNPSQYKLNEIFLSFYEERLIKEVIFS